MPLTADVLELTTETFPVLAEVKTSRLLELQQTLEEARPAPTKLERLRGKMGFPVPLRPIPQNELHARTVELDEEHADLVEVRQALVGFQCHLSGVLEERSSVLSARAKTTTEQVAIESQEAPCLVLDEKAIEYCTTCCADVLVAVSNSCRAVVACRARKDQKAQMLNLIKRGVPGS